jgi:hypothetical protein
MYLFVISKLLNIKELSATRRALVLHLTGTSLNISYSIAINYTRYCLTIKTIHRSAFVWGKFERANLTHPRLLIIQRAQVDYPHSYGLNYSLGTIGRSKFSKNICDMVLGRLFGNVYTSGYLFIKMTFSYIAKYFSFPPC